MPFSAREFIAGHATDLSSHLHLGSPKLDVLWMLIHGLRVLHQGVHDLDAPQAIASLVASSCLGCPKQDTPWISS